MAKYISNRQQNLKIGIVSYTENKTVLEVTGKVGIGTTNPGATLNVVPTTSSIAGLFSGTTSSDMVRITQLGSGNALVVEDSANPDSSPFVVNASGSVGIGTTVPTSSLHVVGNTLVAGVGTFGSNVNIAGTVGIGTIIDIIPYDTLNSGTLSWEGSAGQLFSITNNLTSGSIFSVNDVSGIPSIDVDANGIVSLASFGGNVGVGTTNPTSKLDVIGDVRVSGVVTATTFVGALTGTATTTTNIPNLTGDITSVNSVTSIAAGVIVNADINASAGIVDTKLATISTALKVSNSATTATNANTASAIVARDASGNFSAGTITANLTGTASSTTNIPNLTGAITSVNTTTSLGSFTSAQLATALTDETGSGAAVFATSPTLVTPVLGAATATSIVVGSGVTINASGISAAAGIITATQLSTGASGTGINITTNTISGPATLTIDPAGVGDNTGAVRIKGDFYVDGTQFIVNSTTIELADLRVGIATTVGTSLLLDGGGIGIGSANILKTITWNNTASALTSSEDWNLVSGKQYEIDGTSVLNSTTLGSGVVNSSLTSVGTLGQLNVSGNLGIGTTNATEALTVIGIVSATSFVGDGSGLTGIITSGVASVEISDTAPVGPNAGDLWYNSILGRLFIYYEDVDSAQWVDAAPFNLEPDDETGATVSVGSLPPASPNNGDLWYNSILGRLFIYYEDVDSDQWVDAAPFNSTSASIITFPTGDYDDLSTTTIDAFNQNIGDVSYDCLTYPPNQLVSYDLGLVS